MVPPLIHILAPSPSYHEGTPKLHALMAASSYYSRPAITTTTTTSTTAPQLHQPTLFFGPHRPWLRDPHFPLLQHSAAVQDHLSEQDVAQVLCMIKQSATPARPHEKIPPHIITDFLQDGPPASFVMALHSMLLNEPTELIELTRGGELIICDTSTLEASGVLGRYYKHNNPKSFQRQLYNFGWVKSAEKTRAGCIPFVHPALEYGNPLDTLLRIKRKTTRCGTDPDVALTDPPTKKRRRLLLDDHHFYGSNKTHHLYAHRSSAIALPVSVRAV